MSARLLMNIHGCFQNIDYVFCNNWVIFLKPVTKI